MILLPLIYVGLIVLVSYGVYLYAINGTAVFGGGGRRSSIGGRGALLAYFGPLVIGVVLIVFMIKPLFARKPKSPDVKTLDRAREPLLFQFVDHLCDLVGAPRPRAIKVDCNVNASPGIRGGFFSLFGRNHVLTIGLPLAAGLNLRQLTGVLAHEFGHFAQGTAMRVSYIVRTINVWFARVVYERDAWDESLENAARETGGGIAIVLWLSKGMVWVTRRVLWVLMCVGHAVSCFMLRQMEFGADRYEARVAGSDVFAQTCRLLPQLSVASNGAFSDLSQAWQERKLCDDLPALVMHNARQMPDEVRQKVEKVVSESKTGWFDTHPADRDRIASAARENCKGVFHSQAPSSVLFADFGRLCREASMALYRQQLGPSVESASVISTEILHQAQTGRVESHKAMRRMFQGHLSGLRPYFLSVAEPEAGQTEEALAERVIGARSRMAELLPGMADAVQRVKAADERLVKALTGRAESAATGGRPAGYGPEIAAAWEERRTAEEPFAALEAVASERFGAVLALARVETFAAQLTDEDAAEVVRAERALNGIAWFAYAYGAVLELRNQYVGFATLLGRLQANAQSEPLVNAIRAASAALAKQLAAVHAAFAEAAYPFEHARSDVRLADFVVEAQPGADDIGAVYGQADGALDRAYGIYFRGLALVAATVERVESVMGLELAADVAEVDQSKESSYQPPAPALPPSTGEESEKRGADPGK
jgi:Zn-dependent protease with chaperone function